MANPVLKELGFSPTDRVVVIHADDIGMCQATLPAIAELFEFGLVSSAAMMVPAPWFPGAAAYVRSHPEVDMGIHLTLNSEWEVYRWGPISSVEPASGLIDQEGYFYNNTEATQSHADVRAVQLELRTQIQRGKETGIDPTHVDSHMFCLGHPRLFKCYLDAGIEEETLPILFNPEGTGWRSFDLPEDGPIVDAVFQLAERGVPLVDGFYMMNLETHEDRLEEAKRAFRELSPGITHFILHPAIDSPELRMMAPDWRCRVADYETFRSDALQDYIRSIGVQVIGYKALKDFIK